MKLSISVNALKAAVITAATKEIRYYLCGIYLEAKHDPADSESILNHLNIVSTDGMILFAARTALNYTDEPQTADWQMIVPIDAVKTALKGVGKRTTLELCSLPDGRYTLGDTLFAPLDGRFPDYRRVIPLHDQMTQTPEDYRLYNPNLMVRCHDAMRALRGSKSQTFEQAYTIAPQGVCAVHDGSNDAVAICMPIRADKCAYQGFNAD
jgi:hypothetical protein